MATVNRRPFGTAAWRDACYFVCAATELVGLVIARLKPLMIGAGTRSDVIQRIVGPMVGGMITAPLLSMFVVPPVPAAAPSPDSPGSPSGT